MFIDAKDIHNLEHVNSVVNAKILSGYSDGSFRPNSMVTRAALCKVLYSFVTGNHGLSMTEEFHLTRKWKDELGENIFKSYIAFFEQLLIQNIRYAEPWGDKLLDSPFNPVASATKGDAMRWLIFVCKTCYHTEIPKNFHAFCSEEAGGTDENQSVSREWLAEAIYQCCAEIVQELAKESFGDRLKFFELWSSYGETAVNLCIPNPDILRLLNACTSDEYEMLTFSIGGVTRGAYSQRIPAMYHLLSAAKPLSQKRICQNKKAYQYTSLFALRGMLEHSDLDLYGRLQFQVHMSNAEFLNDPDEGYILLNNFQLDKKIPQLKTNEIYPRREYITCLTTEEAEKLPMWVQYGDGGSGCRIEFEVNPEANFYEVSYVERNELSPDIRTIIDSMKEIVNNHFEQNVGGNFTAVLDWAKLLLKKYGYFFKDKYYSQEKEIRSIVTALPQQVQLWDKPRNGEIFPRSYVILKKPLQVLSVTLGPKCPNPEQIAVALQNKGINHIYRSKIHFQ